MVTKAEICFRITQSIAAFIKVLKRFPGPCCSTYLYTSIENMKKTATCVYGEDSDGWGCLCPRRGSLSPSHYTYTQCYTCG